MGIETFTVSMHVQSILYQLVAARITKILGHDTICDQRALEGVPVYEENRDLRKRSDTQIAPTRRKEEEKRIWGTKRFVKFCFF